MRLSVSILRGSLIVAVLLAWAAVSNAHIIIFKDGFTLHGRVRELKEFVTDDTSGQSFLVTKGVFLLDSDARLVGFSQHHVPPEGVIDKDVVSETDSIKFEQKSLRTGRPMYPILQVGSATEWTADWNRKLPMRVNFGTPGVGDMSVEQRLAVLTPQYLRVDGTKYNWTSFYRLGEFDPATIRSLLFNFPEMKGKNTTDDPAWRQKVYQFFVQAGWYDLADAELAGIEKDLPEQKDTVEQSRQSLIKLKALHAFDEIEKAHLAGRHDWAQKQLAEIPRAAMDDMLLASVRELRSKYESLTENLTQARRLLTELRPKLPRERQELFDKAATAILEELDHDNVTRLETFLVQARQSTPPEPAELLALAVSGWLLGKDAADAKPEVADRLWKARQFVLDYQNTRDTGARDRKLKEYQSTPTDALGVDEMTQVIHHLLPPKAENGFGTEAIRRRTEPQGHEGADYVVQLPPEYRHSRPYPVLIVLHAGGGDTPADMVKRVAGLAARHGYIVAAPDWEVFGKAYEHSTEENERVTDVIVDLRRRFQVDSDRVFLLGAGQGGQVAFDVGLSHPDLFAGVIPMGAAPLKHAGRYWANSQYLPFYVVDGTFSGDIAKANQDLFKKWVPLGFPGIWVQYKGRGPEWFAGELPTIFDWMDRKKDQFKRAAPVSELGRQGGSLPCEFLSLRNSDTRFYWLSTDGLLPNQAVDGRAWKNTAQGGNLYGRIHEGTIHVNSRNHKRLTIWLARGMIDFAKPLTVRINRELRMNNQRIQPSLKVLLEDLYQRGDRQRLYWAKLEFDR
jgi:pimeloyl-ACP methyl ester carboxylesterase